MAWVLGRLREALARKGVAARLHRPGMEAYRLRIALAAGAGDEDVRLSSPDPGETLIASGGARRLVYGLLELAERVDASADPLAALRLAQTVMEQPASRVRGLLRAFCSEVEDPQ